MTGDVELLLGCGFHLVELKGGAKEPAGGPGWQHRAITAPGRRVRPGANLGVLGGCPVRAGRRLVVVDVDVKGGRRGRESLDRLQREHGRLPVTARASTPSGGEHHYLAVPDDVPLGGTFTLFHGLGYPDVDLIGSGRFAVAPPSAVPTGPYDWVYRPDEKGVGVADAPAWLVAWLRLAGGREPRPAAPATRAVVPGPCGPTGTDSLLQDIVRRYPVAGDRSRNPQMARAAASLTDRGLPAADVRGLLERWHRHFAGAYATALDAAMREVDACLDCLRRKVESGSFVVRPVRDHVREQARRPLSAAEREFLSSLPTLLARPPIVPLSFSSMEEKDNGTAAGQGGGWDLNEERVGKNHKPSARRKRGLTPGERQFAEALTVMVADKRERGAAGGEFLMTNGQMLDVLRRRFGVRFSASPGEYGYRQFRRLKAAFVAKERGGKMHPATKVELAVMLEEGRPGRPSRYRLTGLLEAFGLNNANGKTDSKLCRPA